MNTLNPRTQERMSILDFVAMITLVFFAGLAVSFILGGAVLLLASGDSSAIPVSMPALPICTANH